MKKVTLPEGELEMDSTLGHFAATEQCDEMLELIDNQLEEFGLEIIECVNVGDTNWWFKVEKIGANTLALHSIYTDER